jgi:hypothetical protein
MTEGQSVFGEGGLDLRAACSGTEGRETGTSIQVGEPGHAFEGDRHHGAVPGENVDAARHRGAAAPRNGSDSTGRAAGEDSGHLLRISRPTDAVGESGHAPTSHSEDIDQTLAACVCETVEGIAREIGSEVTELDRFEVGGGCGLSGHRIQGRTEALL